MINNNVKVVEDLIKIISKFPGLGPKSAKRIVLKLINNREELAKPLVNTLAQVYKNVIRCKICGNLKSANSNCTCSNKNYDQICVVENIADMWVIQSSGIYKGHYHILGGTLPSFEAKNNKNGLLKNKTFMLTGKLNGISRAEAKSLIEQNSGKIISNVNKKLDYLIVGEKPTTKKVSNAKQLNINIINQKEWMKMLNKTS